MLTAAEWWVGFNVFVLIMLALDLGVFHRRSHEVRLREAIFWSIFWTILALVFNLGLWQGWIGNYAPALRGRAAMDFLTGYMLERALSFDNLFVFAVIFTYFGVKAEHQHRVLFWGILGALAFRAIFIVGGTLLISRFEWLMYVFGLFLIYTGIKLATAGDEQIEPEKNPVLRFVRRVLPVSPNYDGGRFFTRVNGRRLATPLLLVLVFLEVTDVIFAVDSIPAIFGITKDPFIVYTSNIFAILGLRAIYFVLAAIMKMFHYLSAGLAIVLVFIGAKMVVEEWLRAQGSHLQLPPWASLTIVTGVLTVAIVWSLVAPPQKAADSTTQT